jgi:CBS-domain-containing membrane protein
MTQAKEIMRPAAAIVSVDQSLGEAVAEVLANGGGHVVAVDDDQVAGVLDPALLSQIDLGAPELSGEMVGNLVSLTFRTCRPDDEAEALREVFDRSGAAAIIVVAGNGGIKGVVSPSDLPGTVG